MIIVHHNLLHSHKNQSCGGKGYASDSTTTLKGWHGYRSRGQCVVSTNHIAWQKLHITSVPMQFLCKCLENVKDLAYVLEVQRSSQARFLQWIQEDMFLRL